MAINPAMLMMMANQSGGGTQNGESGGNNMASMLELMGMGPTVTVPVWQDAVAVGTQIRGGINYPAVMDIRVVPPTSNSPVAALTLSAGGPPIYINPNDLSKIKAFFNRWPEEKVEGVMPDGKLVVVDERTECTIMEILQATKGLEKQAREDAMLTSMMASG